MIIINLLDWRKKKLKRTGQKLIGLWLGAIILVCLLTGSYGYVLTQQIEKKSAYLSTYLTLNQPALSKVQKFESITVARTPASGRNAAVYKLAQQRNTIPSILSALTQAELTGTMSMFELDLSYFKIRHFQGSLDQALAMFQLLNNYSKFCHVAFAPIDIPRAVENQSAFEFEAQICHDQI